MKTENWGLLGHEWAVDMLKQQILQDSVRQAYLFCGPPGVGRRTLGLSFAKALNCLQPPAPGEFCDTCKTCKQLDKMQYTDLAVIQSEAEGRELKIEQIRALRHSLSLKPYQGKYRIALLLRFQEANANSANALLKTLEEAPSYCVLMLTADTPEQLPPTITSRCEILRLRPLPAETVELFLKEHDAEPPAAHLLAHVSGGRPGYALNLIHNPEALDLRTRRLDEIQDLLRASRRVRFAYADKISKRRKDDERSNESLRETLLLWVNFWRDVLMRVSGSEAPLVNVDRAPAIEVLASRLDLTAARQLVNTAEESIERLNKNVNSRLIIENLLLDWPKIS
jgi:DNA polymerase III subunit delta'